jgi:chromosome segregation ATPase
MGQAQALSSSSRADLAAAISRHQAATDRFARVNAAADQHLVWPAQEAVEQAEQALAQARKLEPSRIVGHLLGDKTASGPSVEECETALTQANDALVRAMRTREALDTQQSAAQSALDDAQRSVRIAISAVVQADGGANAVLARYLETRREAARLHAVLSFLSSRNCVPPYWDSVRQLPPTQADQPWREALTQLETDAEAPLPE